MQGLYRQKTSSNQQKITERLRILQRRHQTSLQNAHQQHRRDGMPSLVGFQNKWRMRSGKRRGNRFRSCQTATATPGVRNLGEEMKHKTDNDLKREQDKIRKSFEQKNAELEASRQQRMGKSCGAFSATQTAICSPTHTKECGETRGAEIGDQEGDERGIKAPGAGEGDDG